MPTLSAFAPPPLLPAVLVPPPVLVVSFPPHAVRASAAVEATAAHFITERKVSPSSKGAPRSRRWELLETTAAGCASLTARGTLSEPLRGPAPVEAQAPSDITSNRTSRAAGRPGSGVLRSGLLGSGVLRS